MIKKILIANRGEIAVRILRACHELGISVAVVYSQPDRGALHVRYADEAYSLGSGPVKDTYLNMDKIIAIAKKCGAEAIHPGYGFLSENRDFAERCQRKGLVFIGPTGESLQYMGRKIRTRAFMDDVRIPVIPGHSKAVEDENEAVEIARKTGFPIMLKAVSGGGGRGIRLVKSEDQLRSSIHVASSEAMASFGSGSLYLEKYIPGARHIELQILADRHGHVVHLCERECSIQRRFQKILEESPSPFLDDITRLRMASAALTAAIALKYEGAGTVEFLVDENKNFYFLELNARLQVEHPVTEMVTGVDIVKEQIRIAGGEHLQIRQNEILPTGSSIVCRIYAEDPENNFLPSPGRIERIQIPGGPGVRVDIGVYEGFSVPIDYDPIVAKVIVWGRTREEAIVRMDRALKEFVIKGIKTNIPFHRWLINHKRFIEGDFNTQFLEEEFYPKAGKKERRYKEAASIMGAIKEAERMKRPGRFKTTLATAEDEFPVQVERSKENLYRVNLAGQIYDADVYEISPTVYSLILNDKSFEVDITERNGMMDVVIHDETYSIRESKKGTAPISRKVPAGPVPLEKTVTAYMPAMVLKILVVAGEPVKKDQVLMVIEAMKMEMEITSPGHGMVKEIHIKEGQSVIQGAPLVTIVDMAQG
jgi:acetyl-CoA carboxylase biotin carboxylase subunit